MRNRATIPTRKFSDLSITDIPNGVIKFKKRELDITNWSMPINKAELSNSAQSISTKVNSTYREVFGPDTVEANEGEVKPSEFDTFMLVMAQHTISFNERLAVFERRRWQIIEQLKTTILLLEEKLSDSSILGNGRILQAYQFMDLHEKIADAVNELYINGHYSNAIEDSIKALNNLVRLRSGVELDGTKLMEKVFSPNNPILKFNNGLDDSDKDEQKGFMMLYSGAIMGLRNPRAHKLIKDDAERALEFIAFISLLAKILDGSKR